MLHRLFSSSSRRTAYRGAASSRAYAIGDIHGRLDLLIAILEKIEADNAAREPAKTYLIFLGDFVDRGPDSRGVIEQLANRSRPYAKNIFLMGNHEEFFLNVLSGDEGSVQPWLAYGGTQCAESYGISPGWLLNATPSGVIERLRQEVPQSHLEFLRNLSDTFRYGDYLFVHAGIRPGTDLLEQSSKDVRWIREGFLEDSRDHGVLVVHGHTIVENPETHRNRIAIDTGAYRSGVLTALAIEDDERWFIQASDPV